MNDEARYPSLDAFYGANRERLTSPEWDYGVMWTHDDIADPATAWPHLRVSWIVKTGEVYALELGGPGRVLVLGVVAAVGEYPWSENEGGSWGAWRDAQTIDRLLDGWAEGEPHKPLSWVSQRIAQVAA